jgi:fission 1 protein
MALPETDEDTIKSLKEGYEDASRDGGRSSSEACYLLVWGLVHSKRKKDVGEGLQLAGALMESDELEDERKKDLVYIKCVALYKLGKYLEAKRQLEEFLLVSPNHRQALQIKEMVDEKLVRDGLIGVGVLSTGALIASIAVAVLSSGRK